MDLEGIMPSEINQTVKDKYGMISLICEILNKQTKQSHRKRDQICGYQRRGHGKSEKGGQKVQTFSDKINTRNVICNTMPVVNTAV